MRTSAAAIAQAARSVEAWRVAREQSEQAVVRAFKLLRQPIYPQDRESHQEQ